MDEDSLSTAEPVDLTGADLEPTPDTAKLAQQQAFESLKTISRPAMSIEICNRRHWKGYKSAAF